MSEEIWVIISFLVFMLLFAGVGMASIRVKKDTTDDYLVAGRGMHPALAALSAVSTWNSGYMFIGFIGFMWLMGYSAIWISIISTIGQLVAWIWLYKYIQNEGNERNSLEVVFDYPKPVLRQWKYIDHQKKETNIFFSKLNFVESVQKQYFVTK